MASLPDDLPSNVAAALKRGNQIEAIKLLREATGLGLEEAKDAIDHHLRRDADLAAAVSRLKALPAQVADAWRKGNKIEALKLLRAQGGLGLKEAKEAIEAFERQQRAKPTGTGGMSTGTGGKSTATGGKSSGAGIEPQEPNALADMIEKRQRQASRDLSPGEVPYSGGNKFLVMLAVIAVVLVGYWLFFASGA